MDEIQIKQSLEQYFSTNRIVIWYDDNAEFSDSLPEIEDVKVINLKAEPHLKVRVTIDIEEPDQKFLIYAPYPRPANIKEDWFIDVSKYAPQFKADKSSIILNNLGLAHRQDLLAYFSSRQKFFKNAARFDKFKAIVRSDDEEADMDLKIISILAKSEKADIFSIIISLFSAWAKANDDGSLNEKPVTYNDIEKMDMLSALWKLLKDKFAYEVEEPSLKDFALRLFASDVLYSIKQENYPTAIKQLLLPNMRDASICLNQWRESNRYCEYFDAFSSCIEFELNVSYWINQLPLPELLKIQTFLAAEKRIISKLIEDVSDAVESVNNQSIVNIVKSRLDGYWANDNLKDTAVTSRSLYCRLYDAILNVSEMVVVTNRIQNQLNDADSFDVIYSLYTKELYKIDLLYRKSIEAIQYVLSKGIDILKPLQNFAENIYNNRYIEVLSVRINRTVNFALAGGWKISEAYNQYEFFDRYVKPAISKDKKLFVIISDGLRYEIANELAGSINSQYRFKAELESMMGVLPSYTALGMSALLPHKKLNYNNKGEVLIDDRPTMSLEQRKALLEPHNGTAIKLEDLLNLGRDGGREFVKPYNLIYIYHNQIDATGDAAKTEENTFNAVTESLIKLKDAISYMVNSLSANNILLTSDHGFLFQYSRPNETNRSTSEETFDDAMISKKRYVIGTDLPDTATSICSNTQVTAHTEDAVKFCLPRGNSLYNFIGGSRFVHGGSMPQEFIVPLLQIRQLKTEKSKEATRMKDVEVSLLGSVQRFTNKIQRFQLIQTEPVSERNRAVTLKIGVYDGDEPVTNVETVTFDSKSSKMDDWKKFVTLSLMSKSYSREKPYSLRLIKENGIVVQDINITIDLVYDNDF